MPIQQTIEKKLLDALEPNTLVLKDESHKHAGHYEEAKAGGTHFRLEIASKEFEGKSRVECHKMIYQILEEELKEQVHALAIKIVK